jgi:3-oxoadipate enol-lactonase
MLTAMVQEHERGLGGWHAEWETLPEICVLTAGALAHTITTISALEVDTARMASNLAITGGLILAEAVTMALAPHLGKLPAHALVEHACRTSIDERRPLLAVLDADPIVRAHLTTANLTRLLDPRHYLGETQTFIDRVLANRAGPTPDPRTTENVAMAETFIDVDGARFHYRFDGPSDAPVLVLSNSLGTDLSMWEPQIAALTQRFRVLRYDTRGHGATLVTAGPYVIEQLGRDVVGLLDSLKIRRAHFCGLSLGGMTGMWLGVHAPERLNRLVLANTAAQLGPPGNWDARIEKVQGGGMSAIAQGVLERWFTQAFLTQDPDRIAWMRKMIERQPAQGYVACCAAVRDMDQRDAILGIGAATLVIVGLHDIVTPPADGRFLADHIEGAEYVELRAAHLSNIEAAQGFTDALLSFLNA